MAKSGPAMFRNRFSELCFEISGTNVFAPCKAGVSPFSYVQATFEDFIAWIIGPEFHSNDVNASPMLKASALKFFTMYRDLISKPIALALLPYVLRFLNSESNVAHSYAAICIEKLLMVKDYSRASLNMILGRVCQDPKSQVLNHDLFESLAALIRRAEPSAVSSLEARLFLSIEFILSQSICELLPYALQLFAQLVELTPDAQRYDRTFEIILTPDLWTISANIPLNSTMKFAKQLVIFMSLFLVKFGADTLVASLNAFRDDFFGSILREFWIPYLESITGFAEIKLTLVASTKLICESPYGQDPHIAGRLLNSIVRLISLPELERAVEDELEAPDFIQTAMGHDASFVYLYNIGKKEDDPLKEVRDPREFWLFPWLNILLLNIGWVLRLLIGLTRLLRLHYLNLAELLTCL
ncbi:OLC1v1038392C1 [Oldenlandia corymbosa var. corymbosa]|uniref:OLC1v1038392C1 n=1 Tax=Oldenlandia corymbosa var. corymbosa TaxID=529605 RepID=A0AAV1CZM2_OLDCO|nr:OLC1v1038392C1 [Oldenlandia corymbosa var. corymbosa]